MAQTILVVDDDPDLIELIQSVLQLDGYQVVGCANSATALAMVRQHLPALVFLDLNMPRPTGWELLQALRQDVALAPTPVLVVSALDAGSDENKETQYVDLGPIDVLSKPFEIDELVERVRRLLRPRSPGSGRIDPNERRTAMSIQPLYRPLEDPLHP